MNIDYVMYKLLSTIKRHSKLKYWIKYCKKKGMIVGENTHVFSLIGQGEPYLIKIGNNTTISFDVTFLTHDASIGALIDRKEKSDLVGRIIIGDHVFIGNGSIILCGCTIGDRSVVAAGSVVVNSIPSDVVVGGNPARIICSTNDYITNNSSLFLKLHGISSDEKKKIIMDEGKYKTRKMLEK